MLLGDTGENRCVSWQTQGFVIGMIGWIGVLYLIFVGDKAQKQMMQAETKLVNLRLK